MARFGKQSLERLENVHPLLREVCDKVIRTYDFTVVYGVRTIKEQEVLVAKGASKTMDSQHLIQKTGYGHAVDIAPYPIDWKDLRRFYYLAGKMDEASRDIFQQAAALRWGGDWDMDTDFNDQNFNDLLHFEVRL